jgi:hypothetical protein
MIVSRNSASPLVKFVYQTFGERFGGLLLAGYGDASPPKKRSFLFTEPHGDVAIDWVIEIVSDRPPRAEEPLVLAALLKLMLNRSPVAEPFYFEMADLMAELDWPDTRAPQDFLDVVVEKYVGLTFRKYEQRRRQRYKVAGAQWGRYKLVSSYLLGAAQEPEEPRLTRTFNRIDFDPRFVKGLNEGRVIFADLDFGRVNNIAAA